jgi:hypothetical protein
MPAPIKVEKMPDPAGVLPASVADLFPPGSIDMSVVSAGKSYPTSGDPAAGQRARTSGSTNRRTGQGGSGEVVTHDELLLEQPFGPQVTVIKRAVAH